MKKLLFLLIIMVSAIGTAQSAKILKLIDDIEPKVVDWRRDFHQNPELSNREFRTSKVIADYLTSLGIEVKTGVAHTGVIGILKGGKPGPVIALRADIDALPVDERIDIPFKSIVMSTYNGIETGVMHACGHDTHIAMMMGVATVLSKVKNDLKGTVKFIFQPAEEGAPEGEEGGAALMVKEGALKNPKVDVIFGLHINSQTDIGTIKYKPEGAMAAAQRFEIKVHGKQSHGSTPWAGIDPIVISAQIINGLQIIISRETELTQAGAVITVGTINGGIRNNILPEEVTMVGTIRTLDYAMQKRLNETMIKRTKAIAESFGATADITIAEGLPITYNDVKLTEEMLPSLQKSVAKDHVILSKAITGAEDFSFFQKEIPGFYFFVGGKPLNVKPEDAPSHHTPYFYIDESGMKTGVKAMVNLTLDYMDKHSK